jgi:hypothetical protein
MIVAFYGVPGERDSYLKMSFVSGRSKARFEEVTGLLCLKSFRR